MSYGKSWEIYPIEKEEIWIDKDSNSMLEVNDITHKLPIFMMDADMIYTDSPWSLGNVNMFNSKSGREYMNHFSEFYNPLLKHIKAINPKVCYLEIGKQELDTFFSLLSVVFEHVQSWKITYYGNKECYLLRGGINPVDFNYTGFDDKETPYSAIYLEKPICVADFCTGRGLTALAANKFDVRFVGTELNKRKLAVCIDKCNKKGMNYEKSIH